jgi:hypothetical protein
MTLSLWINLPNLHHSLTAPNCSTLEVFTSHVKSLQADFVDCELPVAISYRQLPTLNWTTAANWTQTLNSCCLLQLTPFHCTALTALTALAWSVNWYSLWALRADSLKTPLATYLLLLRHIPRHHHPGSPLAHCLLPSNDLPYCCMTSSAHALHSITSHRVPRDR